MKVLFVNENIGGHVTVHHHLRLALAARPDVEATFVDVPAATGARRLLAARVPGLSRLDLDLQPLRAQLAQSAWLHRRLDGLLDGVDAVHLYTHNAGLLSAGRWRRWPTVVSLDTTNAQNAYRLPGRRPTRFTPLTVRATAPFERRVYDAATLLIANSHWAADSLDGDYEIEPAKLHVLPFGIVGPDFGLGPAPGTAEIDRPRLVFVGRSLARKGGDKLLDVFERRFADRAELILVTAEQVDPRPGVRVVDDLQPGDPRLWPLLRSAAAFVFPSEIDMAPNAVIEAMTAGLPVIARPVGALPEMVGHGHNGLLIGPSDDDLAVAIEHLLDRPGERQRMGAASRARAVDRYDAITSTDRLLDVLASAISRHRRHPGQTGAEMA